ncbi:MAG: HEAT repeat domain-containing protein [Desulfomonilaceae bacterium]
MEEALQKFLDDPDALTKLNAVVALASVGTVDDSVIPTLLTAIGNKDESTAKAAGRVLSDLAVEKPDKVLPGLTESLDRNEDLVVINTLKVLRQMKVAAAPVMPKISALYDKSDAQVRMEILDSLASIDSEGGQALPVLVKALKAPEPMVRKEALMGVMRYRSKADLFLEPLSESLKEGDLENRLLAIGIVRGLGQQGLKVVPTLEALTEDPNVRVRTSAISALATFRPPPEEVLEMFSRTLKDADTGVRLTTVGALRQIGYVYPEKVTGLLQAALEVEKNEQARRSMASALASIGKVQPAASAAGADRQQNMKPKYSK